MKFFGRMISVKKYHYDEMQNKKRNEIGSQTFSLMIILLMLDTLFYSMGFHWIKYPTNIYFIVVFCSGLFLIRCALNGAFIAPKQNTKISTLNTIVIMALTMIVITFLSKFVEPDQSSKHIGDSSGLFTIISGLSLLIIIITFVIYLVNHFRENKLDD